MKIKEEHFNELNVLINAQLKRIGEQALLAGYQSIKDDPRVKSHRRRFCFDVFYCIPQLSRHDIMTKLYDYMDDDHLYTALNKIIPVYN